MTNDIEKIKIDSLKSLKILLEERNISIISSNDNQVDRHLGKIKKVFQGIGLIFPIGSLLVNGTLAFGGLQLISDSPYFYYPATLAVMCPGFVLDTVVTTRTIGEIVEVIYNKAKGRSQPDYIKSYHPVLFYLIPSAALIFAFLSGSGDAYVTYDIVSQSYLAALKYVLPFVMMGSSVIFESYTSNDLIKRFVKMFDQRISSLHKRKLLDLSSKFETLAELFDKGAVFKRRQQGIITRTEHEPLISTSNDL